MPSGLADIFARGAQRCGVAVSGHAPRLVQQPHRRLTRSFAHLAARRPSNPVSWLVDDRFAQRVAPRLFWGASRGEQLAGVSARPPRALFTSALQLAKGTRVQRTAQAGPLCRSGRQRQQLQRVLQH